MARLRADFLYEVNRLWVSSAVLGTEIRFERGGFAVEVCFPATDAEYRDRQSPNDLRGAFAGGTSGRAGDPAQCRDLRLVRVLLCRQDELGVGDFETDRRPEALDRGRRFLQGAQDVADQVIAELLDWLRIQGQPWLALHGQRPAMTGLQLLLDEDSGRHLPIGWPPSSVVVLGVLDDQVITPGSVGDLAQRLEGRLTPPLAETLVADAQFLMWREDPDHARAVLTAAIAVEIKTKATLREKAPASLRPLLDVVLDNPRDYTLAVAGLLHLPMKAALARSLQEDDRDLYRAVEKLFRTRNDIAHRGRFPKVEDAREAVVTASKVVAWLESLPDPKGGSAPA